MFLFNKEEVYIGYSMSDLSEVRGILEAEGIKYRYRVICLSGGTTRGGFRRGNVGLDANYSRQYYVYVMKQDAEKAKYLVNKVLHEYKR